jgi:hypothetical protein
MSDERHNASEAAALDAVLDELLQQVASNAPMGDHARGPAIASDPSADAPLEATEEHERPEVDEPLIDPPGTDHTPPDADSASLDAQAALIDREVLSDSLDDLLREATELQQTIDAVTPPLADDVASPAEANPELANPELANPELAHPELADPELAAPEEVSDAEPPISDSAPSQSPAEPPEPEPEPEPEPSLDSLDEQLAALTDDLLAGEIESPDHAIDHADPAPGIAPAGLHADASHHPDLAPQAAGAIAQSHAKAHAARAPEARSPDAAGLSSHASAATDAKGAALAARLRTLLITHAGKLGKLAIRVGAGALLTILALLSAPVRQNRTLQQSIGWLALYTLFLACGVWIYLLVFRGPSVPISHAPAPSILNHADSHPAGHADDHPASGAGHEAQSGQSPAHNATPQLVSTQTPLLNRQTYAKSAASQKDAGAKSDGHGAKDAKGGKEKAKGGGGH